MSRIGGLLRRSFGVIKEHVGTDHFGNKYYWQPEQKTWTGRIVRAKRMVVAVNPTEFEYLEGNIPSEWDAWIRGRRKQPPSIEVRIPAGFVGDSVGRGNREGRRSEKHFDLLSLSFQQSQGTLGGDRCLKINWSWRGMVLVSVDSHSNMPDISSSEETSVIFSHPVQWIKVSIKKSISAFFFFFLSRAPTPFYL
uniref:NADH:ubiquinone oxidoreductase complex assembly factor 2 n=1 Tax=Salmo trutta TaxID=8032 RepID=A0A674BNJ2_SALTR